ncbi:MAG: membrane lipoprotein lipid attachment site-containing protein [Salibacteraceae bacterium]
MKKIILFIGLAFLLYGCPEPDDDIVNYRATHRVVNKSHHKLWLEYRPGGDYSSVIINPISSISESAIIQCPYTGPIVPWTVDSFWVVFDDTVKTLHTSKGSQLVSKSILNEGSWEVVNRGECEVSYSYTFTTDDYFEALHNQ